MKTPPVQPGHGEGGAAAGELVQADPFGGDPACAQGAAGRARQVFLNGNGLPSRWAARPGFTILETAFGVGHNFLATWDAWRRDPARCERLYFVAVEPQAPGREELARELAGSPWPDLADRLVQAWPPRVRGLHPLDFDDGRVHLLLALGDVNRLLPALRVTTDAFYLAGPGAPRSPDQALPRLLRTLGRKAAPDATAAACSAAAEVRAGLTAAGFEVPASSGIDGEREITVARFAPRFVPRGSPAATRSPDGTAIVVGAGLAGAAAARALARLGLAVTVLDRQAEPALEASGNPAGLFHGTVNADDGSHARLFRAAALVAQREYRSAIALGVPGRAEGLLRLEVREGGLAAMRATLLRLGLPADYVQALDAATASRHAGVPLGAPAWLYPGGGWIEPPAWVRHALASPGVHFIGGAEVAGIERRGGDWLLRGATGQVLAQAPIAVLAHGAGAARLLAPLGGPAWPLAHSRGQVTLWEAVAPLPLRLPVAGDGYALPLPGGGLLCGATNEAGEPDSDVRPREADHRFNLQRLQRLTGLAAPADLSSCQGRVGWRLHATDRLPIAGAVPLAAAAMAPGGRRDQARLLPRHEGLFVLTALGARGLTLAPLLGRLVAAQATGTPWPLEQALADAVDPGRWIVRAARAAEPASAGERRAARLQPG